MWIMRLLAILLLAFLVTSILAGTHQASALSALTITDKTTFTSLNSDKWSKVWTDDTSDSTYFLDVSAGTFRTVVVNSTGSITNTVNGTLYGGASGQTRVSDIEKVSGNYLAYAVSRDASATFAQLSYFNILTGANTYTRNNTGEFATSSEFAIVQSKNAVYHITRDSGSELSIWACARDLSSCSDTTGLADVPAGGQIACAMATDGAAAAQDVFYCLIANGAGTLVYKFTGSPLTDSLITTMTGTTPSEVLLNDISSYLVVRATDNAGTERTAVITKATSTLSSVAYTDNWLTYNLQQFDFDGTTRTYKAASKVYLANSGKAIEYSASSGALDPSGKVYAESVNNNTGTITNIDDAKYYRINDSLFVSGSGATWTPRYIASSVQINPTSYTEKLSVPLVLNDTIASTHVLLAICDSAYPIYGTPTFVGDDADCNAWKVLATSSASVGRDLNYSRTSDLIHTNPFTSYMIHALTSGTGDFGAKILYTAKTVDQGDFDGTGNLQVLLLYGQCYVMTTYDSDTLETIRTSTICADDTTTKETIISPILGFPFWSSPWGVMHTYNSTSAILEVGIHHSPAPFDYNIRILNKTNAVLINSTFTANDTITSQQFNLTSYLAGKPLKLEVYSDVGKRIYQSYLDDRPLFFKPVADYFADVQFAGWNILFFMPIIFGALFTRNTVGVGVISTVAFIMVINWLGIIELPDVAVWLIAIAGVIGLLAYRYSISD